jgi:hypothetical protein
MDSEDELVPILYKNDETGTSVRKKMLIYEDGLVLT